jgi:hypothetical protein
LSELGLLKRALSDLAPAHRAPAGTE